MNEYEAHENSPIPRPDIFEHEKPVKDEIIPEFIPTQPPSNLRELLRLAQVKAEAELGQFGPTLAAIALERPNESVSPELRKYEALFGRDSLRVALDLLPIYPALTHVTIHELARLQGVTTHSGREEEVGRIIHEHRQPNDPIALELTRKYGWEWPYYGSVDATPMFMHAVFLYSKQAPGGESIFRENTKSLDGGERSIGKVYRRALGWIENRLNANAEGLLEYKSPLPHGIENQVWRDSWDCYFHADGTLANRTHGIASVEVQQLAFDALLEASTVYETVFDDKEKSAQLKARAETLRESIIKHFWVPEEGYFALGTDRDDDGNLRQLKIRTSNMGHLLRSQLLGGEKYREMRESVIAHLFSPEMLNVSGIRTLATDEVRFRPGAYHNGSVWLWDTYYIAEGLRYQNYYSLATILAEKIHTVINVTQKFPEYVRGDDYPMPRLNIRVFDVFDSVAGRVNRIEQPPQEVQAWTVAADIAREYYSERMPRDSYDARTIRFENDIIATLPKH